MMHWLLAKHLEGLEAKEEVLAHLGFCSICLKFLALKKFISDIWTSVSFVCCQICMFRVRNATILMTISQFRRFLFIVGWTSGCLFSRAVSISAGRPAKMITGRTNPVAGEPLEKSLGGIYKALSLEPFALVTNTTLAW